MVSTMKLPSKWCSPAWLALAAIALAVSLSFPATAAGDDADEVTLEQRLSEVFYRSMKHWRYNYSKIPDRKAGVACIPWQRLDSAFLDNEIFQALGFSFSMAAEDGAIRVATDGCNQMRAHYKLNDCACELVLIGEKVVVVVPEGVGR